MNQFPFNSEELKTSPKMAAIKVGFIKKKKTQTFFFWLLSTTNESYSIHSLKLRK